METKRNLKPFPKGRSGNPGGRPKVPAEVKEAQAILDRGWGRPQQSMEVQARTKTHEEWLEALK